MMALKLLILGLSCHCTCSLTRDPLVDSLENKTTIFGDDLLFEPIFENRPLFSDDELTPNADNIELNLHRLPTNTKPIHYNIFWGVTFNSTPQSFSGRAEIQLEATTEDVDEIVLHCEGLNIDMVVLLQEATEIPVSFLDEPYFQFLRIRLESGTLKYSPEAKTVYTLNIMFNGLLRNDMRGIYKSWFRNQHSDPISWMATTRLQATSARKAFPCYDEPGFKATFDIYVRRPADYKSWSNTRINYSTDTPNQPEYRDDIYHTTPLTSTYLLAVVIAQYDSLPVYNAKNEIIYEVIARPNAISTNQGRYAFDVGQELLNKMNNYTNYDFYSMHPNLKITHASIPEFADGVMENWGLLSYREAYIMYDPVHTNSYFKQKIARMISHDVSHQWFGNLVTAHWWGDVWLHKGFARYYEYFLTHWVESYMGLETRFITEQVHTALISDSNNNPHPLTNLEVGSPKEVEDMFSDISYSKGAAIIRQTEHLLGHEVHKAGLRNYLIDNQFKIVKPMNLFESLETAGVTAGALTEYGTSFSFIEYCKSWTETNGHPLLDVVVNHNSGDMVIRRHRFNINTGISKVSRNWIIPITFSSASDPDFLNTKPTHIIDKDVTVINRGSVGVEWVLLNKQQTGFYRVNYDYFTWDIITDALRGPVRLQIHEYNRAQIVNDVFQFARSGLMNYTKAFKIISFLEFETSYAPWVAAITGFNWLRNRLTGTSSLGFLENLIVKWARTVMAHLTYYPSPNEDFMRSYLRSQLAPIMCELNQDSCRAAAVAQFNQLRDYQKEVPPDSRNWVYCNGLREGTTEDFDFLRTRYLEHNVDNERIVLLQALGCTPHAASLQRLLRDIIESNEVIRPQDYMTALTFAIAGNEDNTQIVFAWIQDNLEAVISAFGGALSPLKLITARLRTEAEVKTFQKWIVSQSAALGDSYNSIYVHSALAQRSIYWTSTVTDDINHVVQEYLVDSAETTFLAASVISFAVILNVLL